MSTYDGMRRSVTVSGVAVPVDGARTLEETRGTVQMAQDELYGPGFRWSGRRRMTWLEVTKGGRPQVNIRLDRDQALELAEAMIGTADGRGLLTREQAITRVASMIRAWRITKDELDGELVIQTLAGM
jgi:hypothetical protein